jgi:hypothetical protein
MGTTALIVEMVIIGFQVATWIIMFAAWYLGQADFVQALSKLSKMPDVIAAGAVIGAWYTLGVVFDALTALVESFFERLRWLETTAGGDEALRKEHRLLRQKMLLINPEIASQLQAPELHLRLLRSTVVNVPLICASGWFLLNSIWTVSEVQRRVYVLSSLALVAVAGYAWWRRRSRFVKNHAAFYEAARWELGRQARRRSRG